MRKMSCPKAWHKVSKKMLKVMEVDFRCETIKTYMTPETANQVWEVPFNNIELLWPTGLLDKNGKEIYEGDKSKDGLVVKFGKVSVDVDVDDGLVHSIEIVGFYLEGKCDTYSLAERHIEIIGTIFDTADQSSENKGR